MHTRNTAHAASRLALALSLALVGSVAWAEDAHHPAGAASAPKSAPAPAQKPAAKPAAAKAMDSGSVEKMGKMDKQIKAMQELHQKFMAAKTPQERSALMAEQSKAMQEAMAAMEGMRGMGMMGGMEKGQMMMDKMPSDMMAMHQMMEKRMEMMQSMMQMMMDRMPAPAAQ